MSLQRVKILGLRGETFCCKEGTDPTINRAFPSILRGTDVSQHSWSDFCDQSDSILKEIKPVKKRTAHMIYVLLSFVAIMVFIAPILVTQVAIENYLGSLWFFYIFIFIGILPCVAFFRIKGYVSRGLNDVFSELTTLCANKSSQFRGITFRFTTLHRSYGGKTRKERYIDIIVTGLSPENDDYTVPTDGYISADDTSGSPLRDDFDDSV